MRRPIFKAGVWTVVGLAIAFAVVSANSNHRRAVTTAAPAAKATVATAASLDDCTSSDVCCARESKVNTAAVAVAPRKHAKSVAVDTKQAVPARAEGAVIAIDPETGELGMPDATQMQQLEPSDDLSHSVEGLTTTTMPDGSVRLNLDGRFSEFASVTLGPNGKKIFDCGPEQKKAAAPTPTTPTLEEK